MVVKITAMCVAVAMICSALRLQRPEMATALSLAAGVLVLALLYGELSQAATWVDDIRALMQFDGESAAVIVKGAGIAVIAQLGSQLCTDASETALAGRIALASRVAMLGLCAPMIGQLTALLRGVMS